MKQRNDSIVDTGEGCRLSLLVDYFETGICRRKGLKGKVVKTYDPNKFTYDHYGTVQTGTLIYVSRLDTLSFFFLKKKL
jgi:hypothetical protein